MNLLNFRDEKRNSYKFYGKKNILTEKNITNILDKDLTNEAIP